MRVIAGTARSLKLVTPEGTDTRPTTDRIKETLFNMLQFDLQDATFLDLFAGSGAIGIEALSRGASYACFVDSSTKAEECIKSNLTHTKLIDKASIYKQDVFVALSRMEYQKKFDLVFMIFCMRGMKLLVLFLPFCFSIYILNFYNEKL